MFDTVVECGICHSTQSSAFSLECKLSFFSGLNHLSVIMAELASFLEWKGLIIWFYKHLVFLSQLFEFYKSNMRTTAVAL